MTYAHLRDTPRWTVSDVLDAQVALHGAKVFVRTTDGAELTYSAAQEQAARTGAFLRRLGIASGDTAAVLLPNSLDFVRTWLGAAHIGAVIVPLNPALTGEFLSHQLAVSGAEVVIVHREFVDNVSAVTSLVPGLRTVVVADDEAGPVPGDACSFAEWATTDPCPPTPVRSRDTACVMFTSGTTGPSKGVVMPHAHCYLLGLGVVDNLGLSSADRYYIAMPLYHANALFMQLYATLIAGGSAVLRLRFSASEWLPEIRRHGCTVTNLLGAMSQFVIDQPLRPDDRDHALRAVLPAPNPPHHEQTWRSRFGIGEVVSAYGMTEANVPLYGRLGESRPGRAGYPYAPYFEVRILDPETEEPAPSGAPGEICVRSTVPYGFSAGYRGMPTETVEAFRNFWFHTGDLGVMDEQGCVTFLDRNKDCIRRRGENISSFEVESVIGRHPRITEVAAYAVPAGPAGTEDEVMLAVVPAGPDLSEADVARHADAVLPRFARPRYIEIVAALPKTPTERVQKSVLRERGVTTSTWDRECCPETGPRAALSLDASRAPSSEVPA